MQNKQKKNNLISIALVIVLTACSPTIEDSAEASLSNEETEERRGAWETIKI